MRADARARAAARVRSNIIESFAKGKSYSGRRNYRGMRRPTIRHYRHDEYHGESVARVLPSWHRFSEITPRWPVGRSERKHVMSSLIDKWTAEHRNFEKLIDVLEGELRLFHEAEDPNYELMLDVVYYMIHYPDFAHHPAEDIVFSRVAERAPPVSPLIEDLHRQHQRIAGAGLRLQGQLEAVLTGAILRRAEVEQSALRYIEYLKHNMQTEEQSLFPLVRHVLDAEDWTWINARLPNRADPLFGDQAEERYRGLHAQIASGARCGCAVA